MERRNLALVLFVLAIGKMGAADSAEPTQSDPQPQTDANPSATSQLELESVTKKGDYTTYLLPNRLFPPGTAEKLGRNSFPESMIARNIPNAMVVEWEGYYADQFFYTFLLFPQKDPKALERMKQGLENLKSIDRRFTSLPLETTVHKDFLLAIFKGKGAFDASWVHDFLFDFESIKSRFKAADLMAEAFAFLRSFHKSGFVAVNGMIAQAKSAEKGSKLSFKNMQWTMKAGEEVGQFPFDPVLTDPVALKDPSFKADPALDYYVLGIELLLGSFPSTFKVQDTNFEQQVLQFQTKGEFEFPTGMSEPLAFLCASLFQNNRQARTDPKVLKTVVDFMKNTDQLPSLQTPLKYKPSDDPWSIPELSAINHYQREPLAQADQSEFMIRKAQTESADLEDQAFLSFLEDYWGIILVGILGVVLVSAVLFFLCRPKQREPADPVLIKRELDPESGDVPTVIG